MLIGLLWSASAFAQLPPPPTEWADWDTAWHADDPGEMAADGLLDKPAGRRGGIVVRDGHFYSGDARVRFWGVNLAFGANFPTHGMADQLARRFNRYGINAVRFHHMDNQPFPNGVFADQGLETLSPEALDRLDYFIAALKARGVYADLNLHVSRNYNHYHRTPDGQDGPRVDKIVDLFDPDLIAAQRQYARDLLTHVNPYTKSRYADEPAVGIVEINNENSLFMWNAERTIADLPEPYAAELKRQWNGWLTKRYGDRAKLAAAWGTGSEPAGPNLLRNAWHLEQHGDTAVASVNSNGRSKVTVSRVDGTAWHVQYNQGGLAVVKGKAYHVTFCVRADRPVTIAVSAGQAHDPWQTFGAGREVRVGPDWQIVSFGFTAPADDANARLAFHLGTSIATVTLADIDLHAGGPVGLTAEEDPAKGSVSVGVGEGQPRHDDWFTFLENTEEAYYTGMRDYLHHDLGVRCPITGTIGFGPMGTYAQRDMDYVDAHAYWQHPTFPGKSWDARNWTIPNTPMVDQPYHATLWQLAATRVAGKPFTVTEYQEPAPNDWAAEAIPEIASFAALQDWDGVFLFAYSHDSNYDKGKIASFFDIEGNPTKMSQVPMGARLFEVGALPTATDQAITKISPKEVLADAGQVDMAAVLGHLAFTTLGDVRSKTAIEFGTAADGELGMLPNNFDWTWTSESRAGSGQYGREDRVNAVVSVGFGLKGVATPFAAIVVVPADPSKPIASANKLLVTAVARARNTDMGWNATRSSVGNQWGHAPVQIEVVHADVTVPGHWSHAWALDPAGRATTVDVAERQGADTVLHLGRSAALGYVVVR